jgi:CRISPR/Cas system CSM-associated protein Csm3 (group 7 of RAMP superfamily)
MAREVYTRLRVKGTLTAKTALHVGGHGENAASDLPVAIDGQGRPYVPGTSLAGALREATRLQMAAGQHEALWGPRTSDHASHVLVEDAQVTLPAGALSPEVREGVGIDRVRGVAAASFKYDRQVLPRGSRLDLEMTWELTGMGDAERRRALGELQALLECGHVRLGACTTRGLGRVALHGCQIREEDWSTPCGVLAALRDQAPVRQLRVAGAVVSRLRIEIEWEAAGPVMVKAEREGLAVDSLPLVTAVGDDTLSFVLPGSGIKGALRTQAERIVRTLRSVDAPADFLSQGDLPLVRRLFGVRGLSKEERAKAPANDPSLGKGAVGIDDCHSVAQFRRVLWQAIETAEDGASLGPARDRLALAAPGQLDQAFHVAIDRWTGGAADALLFTVLEPHHVGWEPIVIELDLERLGKERDLALVLLLLVLRDAALGAVPLGHGANRGMGAVKVGQIRCSGPGGLPEYPFDAGWGLLPGVQERLGPVWKSWCEKGSES